ncbi:hypothetical protein [Sorangium sp. So ce1024]|uniref:hypothetical protein n=1 Tax=unclassified Sorangium TaxID=2621164 RepID=UPI003F071665
MRDQRAMLPALLVSALVHLGAWGSAGMWRGDAAPPPAAPAEEREPIDIWTGTTAALPGSGAAERPADERGAPDSAPAARAPADAARSRSADERGAPDSAPAARAPADTTRPRPTEERRAEAVEPAPPATAAPRSQAARRPGAAPAAGEQRRERGAAARAASPPRSEAARASAGAGEGGQGDFGAAGNSAVRSLGRAFTRAIPPACQADPIWATLPLGSAGKARIVIDVDDAGHIASWRPEGEEPLARHLGNLAKRTIALLGRGTFAVARGSVTAGKQTLEVRAVIRAGAEDGATGAPADLAWRFEGGRGKASFAQPGGRLVEVVVEVVRTEVAKGAPPG